MTHASPFGPRGLRLQLALSLVSLPLWAGCGVALQYGLSDDSTPVSPVSFPSRVLVLPFRDARPSEERRKDARDSLGHDDLGDYTYDREFQLPVAESISRMVATHLSFARSFDTVRFAAIPIDSLVDRRIDSLSRAGEDMALLGEVRHFYGFYDTDAADELVPAMVVAAIEVPLIVAAIQREAENADSRWEVNTFSFERDVIPYIAGTAGGMFATMLMNTRDRDVTWNVGIAVELVRLRTGEVLWDGTFTSAAQEHRAYTGFGSTKFERALSALRDVVNQMVRSLALTAQDSP